jgi:hypothetical protein
MPTEDCIIKITRCGIVLAAACLASTHILTTIPGKATCSPTESARCESASQTRPPPSHTHAVVTPVFDYPSRTDPSENALTHITPVTTPPPPLPPASLTP